MEHRTGAAAVSVNASAASATSAATASATACAARSTARWIASALVGCIVSVAPAVASAQSEGGLYVADSSFSFEQAANRGLAQNAKGTRFFVLALPPHTAALTTAAAPATATLRERVRAQGGVLMVCQRDIDAGRIDAARLAPGVVAVRGFPPPGSTALPEGERYFPDEDRAQLPAGNESLRRLRAGCS
jgi:hypothetical protein